MTHTYPVAPWGGYDMKQVTVMFFAVFLLIAFAGNAMAISTAEFSYNGLTKTLTVSGESQDASSDSAYITISDIGGSVVYSTCASVSSKEFTGTFDTTSWSHETYFIDAHLYSSAGCTGTLQSTAFGGEFAYLQIQELQGEVDDLTIIINSLNTTIWNLIANGSINVSVNGTVNLTPLWDAIMALQGDVTTLNELLANITTNVTTLETTVTALEGDIATLDGRVDDLEALVATLTGDVTALEAAVTALQTDVAALETSVGALSVTVANLAAIMDAMNHGTINLYHAYVPGVENYLEVWGEAPQGSTTAYLRIYDVAGNTVYSDNFGVTAMMGEENMYAFSVFTGNEVDLTLFDPIKYNVVVYFAAPVDPNMVSALFDDLYIMWLADWVAYHEEWLVNITALVGGMNGSVNVTVINDILVEIESINIQIVSINGNITELHVIAVDLQAQIDDLTARVSALENGMSDLWDTINDMNHGTINLFHRMTDTENQLRVWGEAPEDAAYAVICVKDVDSDVGGIASIGDCLYRYDATVGSPYENVNFYDHWFDISGWDPIKYNVIVYFLEADEHYMTGYNVGQLFDDLFILELEQQILVLQNDLLGLTAAVDSNTGNITALWNDSTQQWDAITGLEIENWWQWHAIGMLRFENAMQWQAINLLRWSDFLQWHEIHELQDRVTALEEQIAHIQGGLSLVWDAADSRLRVKTYFPPGSSTARLYAYDSDDHQIYGPITVTAGANNEADYDWNVASWPIDTYTIKVNFLGAIDAYAWRSELFDGIMLEWLAEREYGFQFMESSTFETFQQSEPFGRSIVWGMTPEQGGEYSVQLVTYWTDNAENMSLTQGLAECQWFQGHYTNQFFYTLYLPATWPIATGGEGTYKAYLIATPCDAGEEYVSNTFSIELDDLANPWPVYGLGTVSLTPDSDQYFDGVYWTNQPIVEMEAQLGGDTEWMNDLRCEVWNYIASGQSRLYERWDFLEFAIAEFTSPMHCNGDIDLTELAPTRSGSAPEFDIEVCAHPIVGQVECDTTTFGLDTTPPVIDEESINPGVLDMVSGVWNFSADVTDDGVVRYVEFWLTNKTDANQTCYLGMANNTHDDFWLVQYDTTGECTPDGYYNFTVHAVDYAGNEAELTIDPLIDNTAPVVEDVWMEGFYGSGFTVFSLISDNLAGVEEAYATLRPYTCADPITYTLSWCEEVETEELVCEPIDELDEACYVACSAEATAATIDPCAAACTVEFATCEAYCGQFLSDVSIEWSYGGCVENCEAEHCAYATETQCGFTSRCDAGEVVADGVPPSDVMGCLDAVETTCEMYLYPLEVGASSYGSYEECVDDQTMGCYATHCSGAPDEFPSEWNLVSDAVLSSDEEACFATQECENKVYERDCGFEEFGVAVSCPPVEIVVPLVLTEGDALSGTWTGSLDGYGLDANKHYEVVVSAWDGAGNEDMGSGNEIASFFSMVGYTVTIVADVADPQYAGNSFVVRGGVTSTDGSEATGTVALSPWSAAAPLLLGQYAMSQSLSAGNGQVLTASYAPFPECEGIVYTASTSVAITRAPSSGGGGGGGGYTPPQCEDGYERDDSGRCVRIPEPTTTQNDEVTTQQSGGTGQTDTGDADGDENAGADQGDDEEPAEEPENLLTGAVIGGGLGTIGWLLIVLALIALLTGLYLVVRKK